jgi:hypothetical protein
MLISYLLIETVTMVVWILKAIGNWLILISQLWRVCYSLSITYWVVCTSLWWMLLQLFSRLGHTIKNKLKIIQTDLRFYKLNVFIFLAVKMWQLSFEMSLWNWHCQNLSKIIMKRIIPVVWGASIIKFSEEPIQAFTRWEFWKCIKFSWVPTLSS